MNCCSFDGCASALGDFVAAQRWAAAELEWRSPPFDPIVRGDNIYGRGACDDKGQMFVHLKALEAYLATTRSLPVNVKCLLEGEEEIGSPNLLPLIQRNRSELAADVALVSDTRMLAPGQPAINYAERGALYLELEVSGPGHDLHSGNFGGVVHNPVQALCEILAGLHDRDGRIAIPGVYDSVRSWGERGRFCSGPMVRGCIPASSCTRSDCSACLRTRRRSFWVAMCFDCCEEPVGQIRR